MYNTEFVPAVKHCLANYATFKGRAKRPEFWWFFLFNWVLSVTVGLKPLIGIVLWLGLLLPNLAVGVRRLHDTNRSGWWVLMPLAIFAAVSLATVVVVAGSDMDPTEPATLAGGFMLFGVFAAFVAYVVFLVWCASNGDVGENRVGPEPQLADAPEKATVAA